MTETALRTYLEALASKAGIARVCAERTVKLTAPSCVLGVRHTEAVYDRPRVRYRLFHDGTDIACSVHGQIANGPVATGVDALDAFEEACPPARGLHDSLGLELLL